MPRTTPRKSRKSLPKLASLSLQIGFAKGWSKALPGLRPCSREGRPPRSGRGSSRWSLSKAAGIQRIRWKGEGGLDSWARQSLSPFLSLTPPPLSEAACWPAQWWTHSPAPAPSLVLVASALPKVRGRRVGLRALLRPLVQRDAPQPAAKTGSVGRGRGRPAGPPAPFSPLGWPGEH